MDTSDVTVHILREIRDGIHATKDELRAELRELGTGLRAEIRETHLRIDQTNARIDQTNARLTDSDVRSATTLHEILGSMRRIGDSLDANFRLEHRVERCERDIADLRKKTRRD